MADMPAHTIGPPFWAQNVVRYRLCHTTSFSRGSMPSTRLPISWTIDQAAFEPML